MGNTLTGQIVAETYDSLLKVTDNNQITGTKKRLTDGFGTDTPLLVSTTDVQIDGNFLIESAQFNTATIQTGGVGKLIWNDQDGTLDLGLKGGNVTLQVGQEQVIRVVNKTGSNLLEANYQVVRVDGAQGNRLKVALAQANNDANSAETLGLVTETINDNQEGFITTSGLVRKINTTGSLQGETWADGDMLYLSGTTAGKLTNIKPTAPTHTVIMGYVVSSHATQGQIYVKVDNGYELDELHNVLITTPTNGQSLVYESATGLWKNQTLATGVTSFNTRTGAITLTSLDVTDALGFTPVTNARTITINGTSYDLSADRTWTISTGISGSGTTNYVTKWTSGSSIGNSQIFDNGTNVGIGTASPSQKLDVNGNAIVLGTLQVGDASILGLPSYGLTSTAIIGKSGGGVLDLRNTNGTVVAGDTAGSIQFSVKDDATPGYAVGRIDAITQIDSGTGASGGANLRFLTAGGGIAAFPTERMRITNTGNVGIGTTSPEQKLHISGSDTVLRIQSGTGGVYMQMDSGSSSSYIGQLGTSMYFENGGSERMRITSGGNVGIGTTTPDAYPFTGRLNVAGNISLSGTKIGWGVSDAFTLNGIDTAHYGLSSNFSLVQLSGFGGVVFATNGSERMRITSGGNVGIGTTTFTYAGAAFRAAIGASDSRVLTLNGTGNSSVWWAGSGTPQFAIDSISGGGATFWTNDTILWSERMRITNGGNVGIGTTNPSNKFEVFQANNSSAFSVRNGTTSSHNVLYAGNDSSTNSSFIGSYKGDGSFYSNLELQKFGGNVGIGTTNPQYKLDVTGGINYQNQFNRQTASYTLVLSDASKIVEMNVGSANNLTVPLNSSQAFPIGTEIQVLQYGAGQTTIVATSGVTLRSKSGQLKIANQYTGVTLVKVGTDEWYVVGNLSA